MLQIPISAVPLQNNLKVILANQQCVINIYQRNTGVFLDLTVNGIVVCTNAICIDRVKIIQNPYNKFVGNLSFIDTLEKTDPVYTGFNNRYILVYMENG